MLEPRPKKVRMSGFDLEEQIYDAAEMIRLCHGKTWRWMMQEALRKFVATGGLPVSLVYPDPKPAAKVEEEI